MSTSMPCAGDSHDGTFVGSFSSISSRSHRTTGPAFETVVASYASRVLKRKSPPESVIDSNVGPYVSSILHAALGSETDIGSHINLALAETVPEYHSVMELLEENCNMSEEDANAIVSLVSWDRVHSSHRRALVKNVLFCCKCGYWMTNKSQALTYTCKGVPQHSDGRAKLKRLMSGLHPGRKVLLWPDGTCTATPTPPIYLDQQ